MMGRAFTLPLDFSIRPASMGDLDRTIAFLNDTDEYDIGTPTFSREVIAADWRKKSWNMKDNTRLIFNQAEDLVGYGEAYHLGNPPVKTIVMARTHPGYRGLGLGTYFLLWGEEYARAGIHRCPPENRIFISTLTVDTITQAKILFDSFGMRPVRSYYRMQIELGKPIASPRFPGRVTLRAYRHDQDIVPLIRAYEEAYADLWGHMPQSEADGVDRIQSWVESAGGFDAGLWILAMDGNQIAGFLLAALNQDEHEDTGEVWELGVRPRWRRQGLGQAMLQHIFGEFQRRGKRKAVLDVDTDNSSGATRLYDRVGMSILTRRIMYEKTIREGVDLRHTPG